MRFKAMYSPVEAAAQQAVNAVLTSHAILWLPASMRVILSRIIFLSAYHALSKRKLTRSCMPSRRYFKDAFELSESTVSRITTGLVRLGFISKLQRRKIEEQWQTCLYRLEGIILEKVGAVIRKFLFNINRVASMRHIVSKDLVPSIFKDLKDEKPIKFKDPPEKNSFSDFFERHPELA